jgi:hypothetical protein
MLKFFFWLLLLANAALFAYQRGVFGHPPSGTHEPGRVARQLNPERIHLIPPPAPGAETAPTPPTPSAPQPDQPIAPAAPAVSPVSTAAKPATAAACTEIGNFNVEDAKRFAAQLASALPNLHVTQRSVREAAANIVYIPPQGSKEAAEKKANELRHLGVTDFFIIQDDSSLRWGISLGVFKQAEAARAHLAHLGQKGVHSARLGERDAGPALVAFQIRDADAAVQGKLGTLGSAFPKQSVHACTPA